ncbi:hypothetical protein NDU88_003142 [Pleurodeles waltl]|uniref:Uncharacterized protein n=1 Tax=Pleurodeles waltl TaxID=8319 RepID=A0AAV7LHZ2_PLEWA|nr:hypothetical protein NDU88_003142 [Pleurodeles waltl]
MSVAWAADVLSCGASGVSRVRRAGELSVATQARPHPPGHFRSLSPRRWSRIVHCVIASIRSRSPARAPRSFPDPPGVPELSQVCPTDSLTRAGLKTKPSGRTQRHLSSEAEHICSETERLSSPVLWVQSAAPLSVLWEQPAAPLRLAPLLCHVHAENLTRAFAQSDKQAV